MTYLFIYRMTSDTGLAPCVDNNLLSLACCKGGQVRNGKPIKTGLRYRIGSKRESDYEKDDVHILGIYKNKVLYLARVTEVMPMTEYYLEKSKGRTDDIYRVVNGKLERNNKLRNIHTKSSGEDKRDIAGEYVLLSDDFIYLGSDAVAVKSIEEYYPKFRETKIYSGEEAKHIIDVCKQSDDKKKHKPTKPLGAKCGGCHK